MNSGLNILSCFAVKCFHVTSGKPLCCISEVTSRDVVFYLWQRHYFFISTINHDSNPKYSEDHAFFSQCRDEVCAITLATACDDCLKLHYINTVNKLFI